KSSSAAERSTAVSVAAPSAKPSAAKPSSRSDGAAGGPWSIQVGAFASRAAAARSAGDSARRLGALAVGASPEIVRSGGLYKARLTGFPAANADAA
ncbi:SPOR domain-containing protein, partial [Acinetobacter baumannii]